MSDNIRILEDSVISRIAAAESVTRPASVVKELIENSLDAGATRIDIMLENAGRGLILVSDNGEGMGPEDIVLCARRHATSKISTAEDLDEALTLGFRGEALASVAAVSSLTIRSGRGGYGHEVRFPAESLRPAPFTGGTRVEVRDLFRSVPARLSFLRSDRAEVLAVIETVRGLSISRPHVSFSLTSDGRLTLDLRSGTIEQRLEQVLGRPFLGAALPASVSGDVTVRGWVSHPSFTKGAASEQFLFVNGRQVRANSAAAAARSGYGGLLPAAKHPGFVLFIDLPPRAVDVNAHPSKAEVRFRDQAGVHSAIESAVSGAVSPISSRTFKGGDSAASSADEESPEMSGPLTIGEWEVFGTPDGPCAVNRSDVIRASLRSGEPEDCLPVTLDGPVVNASERRALSGAGVLTSDTGGSITGVPGKVRGDPHRLAALISKARGPAAMTEAVFAWAVESMAGKSVITHPEARPCPVDPSAFERMMMRGRR